jgi:hypothetical protein
MSAGVDSVALEDCVGDWLGGIEIMRRDACSRVSCGRQRAAAIRPRDQIRGIEDPRAPVAATHVG